jgi:hypothetical protein
MKNDNNHTIHDVLASFMAGLASDAENPDTADDYERRQRGAITDDDCFYPRSHDAEDDEDEKHYR